MPRPDSKFLRLAIYWSARLALWPGSDRPGRMQRLDREKDMDFDFHDPLENNFGHSELRVYKNGIRETKGGKINDKVKKKYRQIISERAQLHLQPLI